MKRLLTAGVLVFGALTKCFAQNGSDINQAIPVYFNQIVNDTIDSGTKPRVVYSITLAKGQSINATATAAGRPLLSMYLYDSAYHTVLNAGNGLASNTAYTSVTFNYAVSTPGVYYIALGTNVPSTAYTFEVTATGTPVGVPNPTQSGCVTGQVQSIAYSLQLIAAGLPDSVTIGGTQLCATCTLKPPSYPQLVEKMEKAMGLGIGVSACYDGTGSIFQLTLNHP